LKYREDRTSGILSADEIRASGFTDLIEPCPKLQESSAGQSENGLIVMFPAYLKQAMSKVKMAYLRARDIHRQGLTLVQGQS
jgi:hypothetical protein